MAFLNRNWRAAGRAFRHLTAILLTLMTATSGPARAEAQDSLEYTVKAAYLAKFAPFIEWPPGAFSSPSAPVTICVTGPDPFGELLDRAAAEGRDGDRRLTIRRLVSPEPGCQILFANGTDQAIEAALDAVKNRPVLTVTDSGVTPHGMISFALIDNHVRFDIDQAAADAASIHISSKLLSLARAVKRGAQP